MRSPRSSLAGNGAHWPQENWRVLHSNGETVEVVHLGGPDDRRLAFMTAELEDGTWESGGAKGVATARSPCKRPWDSTGSIGNSTRPPRPPPRAGC